MVSSGLFVAIGNIHICELSTQPLAQKYKNTFTLLGKTFSSGIYIIEVELTVVFEAFCIFCKILSVCLLYRYGKVQISGGLQKNFSLLLTIDIRCQKNN